MKRNKKSFDKFTKRNKHKRLARDRALDEIKASVQGMGVSVDGARIRSTVDGGRGARRQASREEIYTRGVFSGSKSGFGFVSAEECERDIFIPEDKTAGALHGDFVEIRYRSYVNDRGEERTEGRVLRIVEYGITTLVGTLMREPSYMRGKRRIPEKYYLLPDDTRIALTPRLDDIGDAREGDKIAVRLKRSQYAYEVECELICSLGDTFSKEANYEAILIESGMPLEFSDEELQVAECASKRPITREGRRTFGNLSIITIDGEGAKDLDDAISLRRLDTGWQLGVHIADVSYYVDEKSALDRATMARGTSVYFTDKVVPMLPACLSNGACSLNAGEDKYAVSAIITLDGDGEILDCELVPSVIRSRVRGVYSEVNAIFDGTADPEIKKKYKSVTPALLKMRELYRILINKAQRRGYLDMEIAEAEIALGEDGLPTDIHPRVRGDAEKMIEQFMLTANEAVARLLSARNIPCVYRIHEPPPEDKMHDFVTLAHNLGFDTSHISLDKAGPRELSRLLATADERGVGKQISYSLLRSMSKARYSEIRQAHFGLGLEYYCHFTSPIRRLSDLATHRIIRRVLFEGKRAESYASYARRAARAASDTEERALAAERRIENLYKVIYMSSFVGEEFCASVSSVTSFGMFAELDNTCEGLIPISELPGAFVYDEGNVSLRSSNAVYRIGDRVRVRLEEADIIRGKLRFSLA